MSEASATTPLTQAHQDLLERFRAGQRAALARVISIVESRREGFQALLHALHPDARGATRLGITGPPGSGKSTLTAELIERFRAESRTVGVIAVDPTSPYTGGALLGDRIRMNEAAQDDAVFIRSMATRGALGGLAAATREVMDVLAAYGFDVIIVETVGVGQSELDIAAVADTTAVVLVPESGDSIQTMKAGLMEAADLFVVNKADRPGAQRLAKEVEMMLHLRVGQAMKNIPAHHGVQMRKAETARSKMRTRKRLEETRDAGGNGGAEERSKSKSKSKSTGSADAAGPMDPAEAPEGWSIPVLLTTAETGEGLDELMAKLEEHTEWLRASGELERRRQMRLEERVRDAVQQRLLVRAWQEGPGEAILEEALPELVTGGVTPYEVAARIVEAATGG